MSSSRKYTSRAARSCASTVSPSSFEPSRAFAPRISRSPAAAFVNSSSNVPPSTRSPMSAVCSRISNGGRSSRPAMAHYRPDVSQPAPSVDESTARRDLLTIYAVQALRALLYGFASVLVGASLAHAGYSDTKVGLVFTAMLAGFAVTSVAVGTRGDRIGRRRLYGALFLVMGAAGTVFALTRWLPALILAALTGTISAAANESGPITSLGQAMIPHSAPGPAGPTRAC